MILLVQHLCRAKYTPAILFAVSDTGLPDVVELWKSEPPHA
jgi:hypothetical protein